MVLDGAPNHRCRDLVLPGNISLLFLPPYSPELNPKENLWEEIREKISRITRSKSFDISRKSRAVLAVHLIGDFIPGAPPADDRIASPLMS